MPELPEVETIKRGLCQHITGKKAISLWRSHFPLRVKENDALFYGPLGRDVISVNRKGKYLLIKFDTGSVLMHLGMSGSIHIFQNKPLELKKHDHFFILFSDCGLVFKDPRRFGLVLWLPSSQQSHPLLERLGPEPEELTGAYLFRCCKKSNRSIKDLLMDSSIVSGVGNIYANETLFYCAINPITKGKNISARRYEKIADATKHIIALAITKGGTTLKDFSNIKGRPGYFQQNLSVYGRENLGCERCDGVIKKRIIGQRSTFYCPRCQC